MSVRQIFMPCDTEELVVWLRDILRERNASCSPSVTEDMILIATVRGWRHLVMDNCYYSCCASGGCCRHDHDVKPKEQMPCTCGLAQRQMQVLGYIARRYQAYPGFKTEWMDL
jgi:hypothetical protein